MGPYRGEEPGIGRSLDRPKAFFDSSIDNFSGGILESFHGWMPLASLGYMGQSLPSGHTATAIVLGIVLCRRWPHATWAFIALVTMSVAQRLMHAHHYPSDCLWGAALACLIAVVALHPRLAGGWFDDFESGLVRRSDAQRTVGLAAKAQG